MTVLFVSRCLPLPRYFGDRLILAHLLAGLRARGHRLVVAALTQPGDAAAERASRETCDRLATVPERPRAATDYLTRLIRPFPSHPAACWQPAMWELVARLVDEEAPDVVHFLGGIQVCEYRDAAFGRPRLITPYESHSLWLDRAVVDASGLRERLAILPRRVVVRAFERRIYRGFGRTVVLSDADARALRALDPSLPVVVVPNGVEAPDGVAPLSVREPLVTFVGNFSYEPNRRAAHLLAESILPKVRATVPHARLALIGVHPPPEVGALAGPAVEVTGEVDDVFACLQRARVFVSPLTRGAGMKNKVLEALAAGTPVVATRQSLDGLAVDDGVHALPAEGPAELADAAVRVLCDDRLARRLAIHGRRLVLRRHRWPDVVSQYERLYRELVPV